MNDNQDGDKKAAAYQFSLVYGVVITLTQSF